MGVDLQGAGQLVLYAGYVLAGAAAFLIAHILFLEEEARAAAENLEDPSRRSSTNWLVKTTKPIFRQYVVPMVRGKPMWEDRRRTYRRKLITAGLRDELTPDEFIAFKFFLILFFPLVGGFLKAGGFLDLSLPVIGLLGVFGWFFPDLWVNSRIKNRQNEILKSMPFIVDLLALSTEAGLDFIGSIGKVVDKAKSSPLVDEFSQLLKEIKVGSSRAEALREMAARVNMTEINSFSAILISADQMGAPIGRILRQQSDQLRVERLLRAERAGAAAAQKLQFPIIFFLLPAVLLMIGGPFFLSMIYGGTPG